MGKSKYRKEWLLKTDSFGILISSWAEKHSDTEVFCRICGCCINICHQGFAALTQHSETTKHKNTSKEIFAPSQLKLVASNASEQNVCETPSIGTECSGVEKGQVLQLYSIKEQSTVAEILWTMKSAVSNYSFASCENIVPLFNKMFPVAAENKNNIKMTILILSHGNADVERRFSKSRWCLTEDRSSMKERTLNAIMVTKDALSQYNNSPHLVPITSKLIKLAYQAYRSYQNYQDECKAKEEADRKKKDEAERMKKELTEKCNAVKKTKKDIDKEMTILKEKKEEQLRLRETREGLLKEANAKLKKALKNNNIKEANIAQAMIESVDQMQDEEKKQTDQVEKLQKNIDKRKSAVITSFFIKKPKIG